MGVMEIEVLKAIVESKPTGLICEYRDLLRETIHLEVSDSTVCHYVNNILLMTLKETTVIRVERYYPENVQKYHEFLVIVFNKPAHKLHFFDEMMGTPRGKVGVPKSRSNKGTRSTDIRPNPPYYRVSVNGITTITHGSPACFFNACNQTTTVDDFMDFFFGANGCVTTGFVCRDDIVLIDNCQTHQSALPLLRHMLHRPEFNLIELMWSKVKYSILRYGKATKDQYFDALRRAMATITPMDMQAWYQHCGC